MSRNIELNRIAGVNRMAAVVLAGFALLTPAAAVSVLSLGPRAVQTLVAEQLFNRGGRWYLIDDGGGCFTYLEYPRTHLEGDRLVLSANLSSRLGQSVGGQCAGADFASKVTLSGKLRGADSKLVLDDIRIDRVEDEATRSALDLFLKISPQALPRTVAIDMLAAARSQTLATGGLRLHVDQFRILNITTRPDAMVIQYELGLSAP